MSSGRMRQHAGVHTVRERDSIVWAAVGAGFAAALVWLGPPGADVAAHVYQRGLFLHQGFVLWNNFWYAGRYTFVTYSLLYYPLAALIGIKLLAVLSVAAAVIAFAAVVRHEWGAQSRWAERAFAVVWAFLVLSGAYPFMLGCAFALMALAALQRRRRVLFAVCALISLAASPVSFLLLAVVLASVGLARRPERAALVAPTAVIGTLGAVWLAVERMFPAHGHFPFSVAEFAAAIAFCLLGIALTSRIPQARLLCWLFLTYLVACSITFALSSPIGENIARLRFMAIPLAVLTLTLRNWRPRFLCVGALALAVSWNLTPLGENFAHAVSDPAANPVYWQSTIRYLHDNLSPAYRVEAVDTTGHWPADFLALARIPLARGWFRQEDFPQNGVLYGKPGRAAYLAWLRKLSIRYVVLTSAPPDYSARAEAELLRSGRAGLPVVFRSEDVTIYSVPHPRPLVSAPARVLELKSASIRLAVPRPGSYTLGVMYAPYWQTSAGCVERTADGMTRLIIRQPGTVSLRFQVTAGRAFEALTGNGPDCR
jgi:hypothetical protein